ncbi:MAG TPA: hypothetical protein VG963_27605 [Polyangiaceae bacterium]|nr:hypothetical protein [Polyangiaceae bacterium]
MRILLKIYEFAAIVAAGGALVRHARDVLTGDTDRWSRRPSRLPVDGGWSGALIPGLFVVMSACGSDNANEESNSTTGDAGAMAGVDAGAVDTSITKLSGTLGALGAVMPTVSSIVIANSGEVLVYMASAPLTCAMMQESRWLGSLPAGSQVVEIVVKAPVKVGTVQVDPGEVNYAPGGMSSAYEKNAASGSITFVKAETNGPVEGTVTATYNNPAGTVSGPFHAEFCAGGQQY